METEVSEILFQPYNQLVTKATVNASVILQHDLSYFSDIAVENVYH
jgi:hypothetical protein